LRTQVVFGLPVIRDILSAHLGGTHYRGTGRPLLTVLISQSERRPKGQVRLCVVFICGRVGTRPLPTHTVYYLVLRQRFVCRVAAVSRCNRWAQDCA
jgi:hypothetical protein